MVTNRRHAATAPVQQPPARGASPPAAPVLKSRRTAANRTPWQEFTLQDGCHLRTFWQGDASAPALFIPF